MKWQARAAAGFGRSHVSAGLRHSQAEVMSDAIPAILVLGKDSALRRVLTDAFETEGLEARAFEPARDELPRGDPRVVILPERQSDGVTACQVRDWRRALAGVKVHRAVVLRRCRAGTEADVVPRAPRLEELIARVAREVEG